MKKVPIENLNYHYDQDICADLSHRRINLIDRNWNDFVFYALDFSQGSPDTHIFPEDMTGAVFINCNLDNVFLPEGNTVIGGTKKKFRVQNDGRDWYLNEQDQPTRPTNEKYWVKHDTFTDPMYIPETQLEVTPEHIDALKKVKKDKDDLLAINI